MGSERHPDDRVHEESEAEAAAEERRGGAIGKPSSEKKNPQKTTKSSKPKRKYPILSKIAETTGWDFRVPRELRHRPKG